MSGIEETAASVRARIREARRARSPESLEQEGREAVARFLRSTRVAQYCDGRAVSLYRAMPDELSLLPLEEELRKAGARLLFPRISAANPLALEMVEATGDPGDWHVGPYGFEQPNAGRSPVKPDAIDLIVVPGVAFGQAGERIGRGKGHYDRFLPQAAQARRIALVFDFQLLPSLPQNPWDQRVHWIFTSARETRLGDESALFR